MPEPARGWNIRRKLVVAFCALALLPTLCLALVSYVVASRALEANARRYSHDIMFQAGATMDSRLQKVEEISFNVLIDRDIQRTLDAANTGGLGALEGSRLATAARGVLEAQVLFHDEINAIWVEADGGQRIELDKARLGLGPATVPRDLLVAAAGGPVWTGASAERGTVALGRIVNSMTTQRPLGSLVVEVPQWYLSDVISSTQSVLGGDIMVVDGAGVVVASSDAEMLRRPAPTQLPAGDDPAYAFRIVRHDGVEQYVATSEPLRNGWRIVAVVPSEVYRAEINALSGTLVVGAVVILALAAVTAVIIADNLARPIRQLSDDMRAFGEGDLAKRSHVRRGDEIGRLGSAFDAMADNITALVDRVYAEENARREFEVRSLRMQLNPHFLYNTLETINWMARKEGADDAGVMANSLGSLLRATIDAADNVPLEEEIGKLAHYLQIQGYRYGDRLTVRFDIDPATTGLLVPTLILQPLVENAIMHGVAPSLGPGTVSVSSKLRGDQLVLAVADDGVGMAAEPPRPAGDRAGRDSVGLSNVVKRIEATFQGSGRVDVTSELGEGTTVTITLPAREHNTHQKERHGQQL
ncbi:MAG: sensor histidine kinase [Arachnia sp.]